MGVVFDANNRIRIPMEGKQLTGIAIVRNRVMVTQQGSNMLHVFTTDGKSYVPQAMEGLKNPSDMTSLQHRDPFPERDTLVIIDTESSKLHVYPFDRKLSITSAKTDHRLLGYRPVRVSPGFPCGLVVADDAGIVHVLSANLEELRSIRLTVHPGLAKVQSVVQVGDFYVVLFSGEGGEVQWFNEHGESTNTYDSDDSPLNSPQHMVAEFGGRLLLADTRNKRIQLVSADGHLVGLILQVSWQQDVSDNFLQKDYIATAYRCVLFTNKKYTYDFEPKLRKRKISIPL